MTIDEQLKRLEDDVRRLKIEFDIFFNGGSKRPPYDTKARVENIIKRLADSRRMSFGQRFYYNSIVARYVSFNELWRRMLKQREEGSLREAASPVPVTASSFAPIHVSLVDGREQAAIEHLFHSLVQARKQCGESSQLSFEQFQRLITNRTAELRHQLNCQAVIYTVAIEDGQVKFKARPKR